MKKILFFAAAVMMFAACQKAEQTTLDSAAGEEMGYVIKYEIPKPFTEEQLSAIVNVLEPVPTTKSSVFTINTESALEAFGTQGRLLVVYFWASWCGPCKLYSPIFHSVAESYSDKKCLFGKVDVDSAKELAVSCRITTVPTTLFIKDMTVVAMLTGACSKDLLKTTIDEYI